MAEGRSGFLFSSSRQRTGIVVYFVLLMIVQGFFQAFSKYFLPALYDGKNSIFNGFFKLNPSKGFFY